MRKLLAALLLIAGIGPASAQFQAPIESGGGGGGCKTNCTFTTTTLSGVTTFPGGGGIDAAGEMGLVTAPVPGVGLTVHGQGVFDSQILGGNMASNGGAFYWVASSTMFAPVDGNIQLSNNAATTFGRLQLGGTTSSFPAIKRVAATLNFRLADDSADTSLTASTIVLSALAQTSAVQSGTVCYNTNGTVTYDASLGCLASLEELKDIKAPITDALTTVQKLDPFWFRWKQGSDMDEQPGLGAHQVESVDKRLVAYGPDGELRGVRYQEMTALLVAAIKEMNDCHLRVMGACWF